MALMRLLTLFAVGCVARDLKLIPRSIPPHLADDVSPKFFTAPSGSRRLGNGLATLTGTVLTRTRNRMDVQVEWKDLPEREISERDWIGVFDEKLLTQFHAPIKFQYVFQYGVKRPLKLYGSVNFTVYNMRASYVFIYISGNIQYPTVIAQSDTMSFESIMHPQNPHIALSTVDPTKMLVMWTQHDPQNPELHWGTEPDNLDQTVIPVRDTYTKRDFCDVDTSPAARQGWFDPGHLFTAEMSMEAGKTYYYTCGDADDGWLPVTQRFTAPPAADTNSTRLILLADMGNAPLDGTCQHSWDFHNRGELPSLNTSRLAAHILDKEQAHAVIHIGDVAYAVGYLSEWDEFMTQIEPVASRIPWMASIGNHEVGWSQSDPYNGTLGTSMDSGGECGVPFLKRFPFAMQTKAKTTPWREAEPWYSFDIGSVHFTMISSEHDFRTGTPQWKWMVSDLSSVDRSKTPWVAVTSHRAMYIASDYAGDLGVAKLLRDHVEPQLLKFGVDFFLAGHHHSYQRFCKFNNGTCVDDKSDQHGVNHFIIGMAGYDHSPVLKTPVVGAQFLNDTHWGATYWEFTHTTASMKFLDGATEEVVDQATFQKAPSSTNIALVV